MSQKSGPGWVRGTGRRDCPVGYPVKGNEPSNVYYEPGDRGIPRSFLRCASRMRLPPSGLASRM